MPTIKPLADIRVLAIESYGAGPWATLQLAECRPLPPTASHPVSRFRAFGYPTQNPDSCPRRREDRHRRPVRRRHPGAAEENGSCRGVGSRTTFGAAWPLLRSSHWPGFWDNGMSGASRGGQ